MPLIDHCGASTGNSTVGVEDYLLDRGIDVASEGWTITSVSDISDDGRVIIGTGFHHGGVRKGWMATMDVAVVDNRDDPFSKTAPGALRTRRSVFTGLITSML